MSQPLTIHVLQMAHTDLGYTHPRAQIELMYLEHYDRVLDLCARTAENPPERRFKWTCETAWQVKHYLEHRPHRLEEFLGFVRSGQIDLTANYLHFTDVVDADLIARSLEWIRNFCADHGLPLPAALHSDINGWPWALADELSGIGVDRFASQIHIDSGTDPLGRRGSTHYQWLLELTGILRGDAPIRVPQAFWWRGPEGGQVLHWLGEHYLLGNVLGLGSFRLFGADKSRYFTESDTLTADDLFERASVEIPKYVARLRDSGYELPILMLSTGGYYVDNSPPDDRVLEVIGRLTDTLPDISLRTSTLTEWFDALDALGREWPTHEVAWPDHWAHGLGSTTARIAQARRTQRRRPTAIALTAQTGHERDRHFLDLALERERESLEHTFGAWSTEVRPTSPEVAHQFVAKELTFHEAEMYLDEAIGSALRRLVPAEPDGPRIRYEGPDLPRTLHFNSGDQVLVQSLQHLVVDDGTTVSFQADQPGLPNFVAVVGPATEQISSLRLETNAETAPESAAEAEQDSPPRLANSAWTVQVDPATGELASLVDASGHDWVEPGSGFGRFVHTTVTHPAGRPAVHNLARFIALDTAEPDAVSTLTDDANVTVAALESDPPVVTRGEVFDEVAVTRRSGVVGSVTLRWRAYHEVPYVDLVVDWDKEWNHLAEAAYLAFPFAGREPRLRLETGGAMFTPGEHGPGGQLPGTCSTYYTIQRAAHVETADASLLWLPIDAPLVMTNELDYNRWETDPYAWNGFLASMPVNHFWHTNFPTSQRGTIRLRYRLAPCGEDLERSIAAALPLDALGWR